MSTSRHGVAHKNQRSLQLPVFQPQSVVEFPEVHYFDGGFLATNAARIS
jgi:hypothetical protein